MRVRLVSGAAEPFGAVVHALAVADGLEALGHRAEVWGPDTAGAALQGAERARVRTVAVPRSSRRVDFSPLHSERAMR